MNVKDPVHPKEAESKRTLNSVVLDQEHEEDLEPKTDIEEENDEGVFVGFYRTIIKTKIVIHCVPT